MPRGQKVSPHRRGRRKTHFLVRTSTIFGTDVHDPKGCRKTLYNKKFALIFWAISARADSSSPPAPPRAGPPHGTAQTMVTSGSPLLCALSPVLSGIVSCDAAAIRIRTRIVRCQRPAKRQKHKHCETQARFLPPLLLVGSQQLVLKVPKRGQFHAAIRVAI